MQWAVHIQSSNCKFIKKKKLNIFSKLIIAAIFNQENPRPLLDNRHTHKNKDSFKFFPWSDTHIQDLPLKRMSDNIVGD